MYRIRTVGGLFKNKSNTCSVINTEGKTCVFIGIILKNEKFLDFVRFFVRFLNLFKALIHKGLMI